MTVALRGENNPKLKKMTTSQEPVLTKNGIGNALCPPVQRAASAFGNLSAHLQIL